MMITRLILIMTSMVVKVHTCKEGGSFFLSISTLYYMGVSSSRARFCWVCDSFDPTYIFAIIRKRNNMCSKKLISVTRRRRKCEFECLMA